MRSSILLKEGLTGTVLPPAIQGLSINLTTALLLRKPCVDIAKAAPSATRENITEGTVQWAWQARVISQQDSSVFQAILTNICIPRTDRHKQSLNARSSQTLSYNLRENKAHLSDHASVVPTYRCAELR